jgi:hypothetical protein
MRRSTDRIIACHRKRWLNAAPVCHFPLPPSDPDVHNGLAPVLWDRRGLGIRVSDLTVSKAMVVSVSALPA